MGPLLLGGFLLLPVLALGWWLASRRDWHGLTLFAAIAAGLVALALYIGYQDYKSTLGEEFLDAGMQAHLSLFGAAGLLAADWLAVGWAAFTWLAPRRSTPTHATRAERRRQARGDRRSRPRSQYGGG